MKIRMNHPAFEESMKTVKDIAPRIKEVLEYLKENGVECEEKDVKLSKDSYDERNDWNTFKVLVKDSTVAFTNDRVMTID